MDEFDVLIQNANIVEGTGKEAYKGSIGIVGDRVATLGEVKGDAKKVVDAEGLTALPGFVDAHSHAEGTLLWYPRCESYVMQGVTTFVGGQCGGSPGPVGEYGRMPSLLRVHLADLDPYKFYPERSYSMEQVNEWMEEIYGWTMDWKTMGGFFKRVEDTGVSMNYAPLVGHGTIRTKVMGSDYKRHSTEEEQAEMRKLIAEAMDEGCIGMSTGLDYDPDVFASQEEIVDGVSVLKEYGGIYSPHWRRTGRRRGIAAGHVPNEPIKGLMECVDVYKKTGVRLHFAHLSAGWQIYPPAPDELNEANQKLTIDMITRESKGELDITWDAIPALVRGYGTMLPFLCSRFEPWLRELGSREAFAKWLKVKAFREEIKDAVHSGKWYINVVYNPNTNPRWAEYVVVVRSKSPGLDGKSIAQIAEEREADAWETWFDVITEDPDAIGWAGRKPSELTLFYTHPLGMIGLDTPVFDDKYQGKNPPYLVPEVNAYSAYPIFYNKMVRDERRLTLDEAVQSTATRPAKVYNLEGRGVVCEGSYADIVLMDLPNLKVLGNEVEARRYPEGLEYVFVNGVAVVEDGEHTDARPGRVLKQTG